MPRPKGARGPDYDRKRATLLTRMGARLARLDDTRPSLRQLAAAAEVTVPTLRHYFGTREEIVAALFADYRLQGEPHLRRAAVPNGSLEDSLREFLIGFAIAMRTRGLGEIVAIGLVEGLLNRRLGPAALANIIDPAVEALMARLEAHHLRGELMDIDLRNAALALLSPVILAIHHQDQLFGAALNPLDVGRFVEDLTRTFVRAYRLQ